MSALALARSAGSQQAIGAIVENLIVPDGSWTWFQEPRALRHVGTRDQLYVTYVTSTGSLQVASYDFTARTTASFEIQNNDPNDHSNPSLYVRPDGRILVFFAPHNGPTVSYRLSTSPEDITAFGATVDILAGGLSPGYTYPNVLALPAESDRIYCFFRDTSYDAGFVTSDDDGATWTAKASLVDTGVDVRPYSKFASNFDDEIHHFFSTGHPEEASNSLYHYYLKNGNAYKSDGTLIRSIAAIRAGAPLTPSDVTLVYDFATASDGWVWDIAIDLEGRPRVTFATLADNAHHQYWYGAWTGSAWELFNFADGGGSVTASSGGYSGGLVMDRDNPRRVWASREVSGEWEMEEWYTAGPADQLAYVRPITQASSAKNIHPVAVRAPGAGPKVLWVYGTYTSYTDYLTSIQGRPGVYPATSLSPLISGTALTGEVLTCTEGTWIGSPTAFAYQWYADGVAIIGETASSYTVVSGDDGKTLTCGVTATNGVGSTEVVSPGTVASDTFDLAGASGATALWDASLITGKSPADPISLWEDVIGARDFAQATGGSQPTYRVVNGVPVVRFVSNRSMTMTGAALTQPLTVFHVSKINTYDVGNGFTRFFDGSPRILFQEQGTGWIYNAGASVSGGTRDLAWNVWTQHHNGASSYLRKNGVQILAGNPGANGMTTWIIGHAGFLGDMDMHLILVCVGTLSSGDRTQIEDALLARAADLSS